MITTKHLALTKEEISQKNTTQSYLDMAKDLKICDKDTEAKIINTGDHGLPAFIEFKGVLQYDFEEKLHEQVYGERVVFDEFLQSRGWRIPKL